MLTTCVSVVFVRCWTSLSGLQESLQFFGRRMLKRMFLQSEDMLHVLFAWLHIFEPFYIKVSCVQKAFESCNGKAHESDESKEVGAETIHGKGKNSMENSNLEAPNFDSQGFIETLWPTLGKAPFVLSSAQAVASVRKELKVRKRDHPALFMLGAAGKHIYEAVQAVFWVRLFLNLLWLFEEWYPCNIIRQCSCSRVCSWPLRCYLLQVCRDPRV